MARSGGLLRNSGLLILRVGASATLFLAHGWPKITHFNEMADQFANPIGIGATASLVLVVFAEVFCTALVALGLLTRIFAAPIVIFFTVAVFIQHLHDPFGHKELAVLYGLIFLALLFTGPGRFSLDAWLGREGE
jgi:putative oxidoreductase